MSQTKSVLLKTSASSDVQYSGGEILIAGLEPIKQSRVINFSQINYKAEVRQVVTVGSVAYTPTGATRYAVSIGDVNRRDQGYTEQLKVYSYVTPDDVTTLGGSAALQREAIHLALIAQINSDANNYVAAATLTGGNGFTITDDAGYFPYNRQGMNNRKGASTVKVLTNLDGTGFASTNYVLTTAAVYAVGEGLRLLNDAPVFDFMTGNLISGEFSAPVTVSGEYAVSGQKYNMFSITYLNEVNIPTITGIKAYSTKTAQIFADNGAGSSTANLAGYIAFEKAMHRGLFNQFSNDPNAQVDFLDNVILFQGAAGAVPTTTGENKMVSDAKWVYNNIGTNTITVPTPTNAGLLIDQDLTDTEGAEYTPSLLTGAPQEFVVGKTDFSVFARVVAADWTDAAWQVGFRKKAAHAADFNNYTDLASVGTLAADGDLLVTNGILNNAATVSTSTTIVPTNAAYLTVEVLVNKAGVVTCKLNDVVYPVYSAGTTPLVFDAGDIMIPFVRAVNISGGDPDLVLNEVAAVASASWKY
jgi:hypothetical protein